MTRLLVICRSGTTPTGPRVGAKGLITPSPITPNELQGRRPCGSGAVRVQVDGCGIPLTPGVITQNARLFQPSLALLRRPVLSPGSGVGPKERGAAEDPRCLYAVAAIHARAKRPATTAARNAILHEFIADQNQRGRSLEQAQPADVAVHLYKWAHGTGTYEVGGVRCVAPTSLQQRISHLKLVLSDYPSFREPWNDDTGTGEDASLPSHVIIF